jgi:hypothetical protein
MVLMSSPVALGHVANDILADLYTPEQEVVVLADIRFPLFQSYPVALIDIM